MNCAIVHFEDSISKWEQLIFKKKLLQKSESSIKLHNGLIIPVYSIPICKEKPSNKMINRFISYLKDEKVEMILLSDAAEALSLSSFFINEFRFPDGKELIIFKLYDILRKCAEKRKLTISDMTLTFISNEPDITKLLILQVCQKVKKIKVQTENPSLFTDLTSYFLNEYGLYIDINHSVAEENEIIINLMNQNEGSDIYINDYRSEIIFGGKKFFEPIKQYKKLNEKTLEFLLYAEFGNVTLKNIKQFFNNYPLRVIKLIK